MKPPKVCEVIIPRDHKAASATTMASGVPALPKGITLPAGTPTGTAVCA